MKLYWEACMQKSYLTDTGIVLWLMEYYVGYVNSQAMLYHEWRQRCYVAADFVYRLLSVHLPLSRPETSPSGEKLRKRNGPSWWSASRSTLCLATDATRCLVPRVLSIDPQTGSRSGWRSRNTHTTKPHGAWKTQWPNVSLPCKADLGTPALLREVWTPSLRCYTLTLC